MHRFLLILAVVLLDKICLHQCVYYEDEAELKSELLEQYEYLQQNVPEPLQKFEQALQYQLPGPNAYQLPGPNAYQLPDNENPPFIFFTTSRKKTFGYTTPAPNVVHHFQDAELNSNVPLVNLIKSNEEMLEKIGNGNKEILSRFNSLANAAPVMNSSIFNISNLGGDLKHEVAAKVKNDSRNRQFDSIIREINSSYNINFANLTNFTSKTAEAKMSCLNCTQITYAEECKDFTDYDLNELINMFCCQCTSKQIEPAYVEQTFKAMMSQSKQTNSRQKWFYLLVVLLILFLIILVVIIAYCVRRLCKKRREKVLEYPPDAEQTEKGNVEKEQPVTTTKLQSDELDTISNDTARSSIEAEAKPDSLNGNSFVNSEASLTNPVSSNGGEINNDSDATDTTVQEDNENSTKYVNLKNLNTNNNNNNNISRMMVKAMSATRPPVELKSVNMALNDEVAVFDMMARKRDESSKEVKVNYHKNCRSNNPSSSSQTVKADSGFIKKKLSSLNSSLKHQKQ